MIIESQPKLTFVFTREGEMLFPVNNKGEITTFGKYAEERKESVDFFERISVNNDGYKRYLADKLHEMNVFIGGGTFGGESNRRPSIVDAGFLSEEMYDYQIEEMKNFFFPVYIRDERIFAGDVVCIYLLLPEEKENIERRERLRKCKICTTEQLENLKNLGKASTGLQYVLDEIGFEGIEKFAKALESQQNKENGEKKKENTNEQVQQ